MKTTLKWDCLLRGVKGFMGIGAGFLAASFAFVVKAWLVREQAQLGEVLLWLYLAAWGKVLAIGVVGTFLILVIVRALRTCQERNGLHLNGGSRKNIRMTKQLTVERVHAGGARHS